MYFSLYLRLSRACHLKNLNGYWHPRSLQNSFDRHTRIIWCGQNAGGGWGGGGGLKVHSLAILTNCVLDFCSVYFFVFRWIIWLFVAWRLIVLCVRLFVCCLFYSFLSCVSLLFVSWRLFSVTCLTDWMCVCLNDCFVICLFACCSLLPVWHFVCVLFFCKKMFVLLFSS